jgi:hypothetical protein
VKREYFIRLFGPSFVLAAVASACSDPLLERQDITELRIIAARVEPVSDPSRATLAPGERARVSWLVVGPDGPALVSHGLSACVSTTSPRGIPTCAGEPSASEVAEEPTLEATLELEVPQGSELLMSSVFCTQGKPALALAPEDSFCEDDSAQQELGTYEVPISNESAPNHHPDLTGIELSLDGMEWPEPSASNLGGAAGAAGAPGTAESVADPCESPEALRIARDRSVSLQFILPASAREARPDSEVEIGAWETLQISQLSTRGHFERPFTVFESDATSLASQVDFQAPNTAGGAYLYLVVRDLRGGVSVVERRICVE